MSGAPGERDQDRHPYNVLFLCTGNSARSIFAEAALARLGSPRFRAFSAGSQPKDAPHPMASETLARLGYETAGLRSKSWEEFTGPEAPALDFVFTVCGNAAGERCPIWAGDPIAVHWGVDDPAAFEGTPDAMRACFERIHDELLAKVEALVALDPASLDEAELTERLRQIGRR
ncbi:MAG: ArsR family transcriptional regulator [Deltaproteobacteria bacterium]|jgi:protein-tyrosine-phosphatase|nr:ArsR family transcriptional regulator [Deltaproteobacteria bacterium]